MLDLLLFYQSELMGTTGERITQSLLDKERGIVKNENREYQQDGSFGRVPRLLAQAMYPPGHPYATVGLGSLSDLDAATPADAVTWLTTHYVPANAVLVVAGDFDAGTIKGKIERYFGNVPQGTVQARPAPAVAHGSVNRHQTVYDRVPGPRLYRAWNLPEWGSADATYLEIASVILGGGTSSRLYQRLVQRDKIATNVSASVNLAQLGSQFSIVVTPRNESDLSVITWALDDELARFLEHGPSPEELRHAKRRYRATFLRGIERIGSEPIGGFRGRSDLLAENEVIGGRADFYRTTLSRVESATTGDLRDAATRWLRDGAFTLELRRLPADTGRAATRVDRSNPPQPERFPKFRSAPVQQHNFTNGLRLLLVPRPAIPLVELRLRIGIGSTSDRDGTPGRAELTTQLLSEGTTRRSASGISHEILDMGARISTSIDDDASVITLSGPASEMPRMLDLLSDLVINPVFPEAALEAKRAQHTDRLQRERGSAPALPGALLQRLLDGSEATPALLGPAQRPTAISRDDLLAFFRASFRPDNATLIVAGATTKDLLVPQVERAFGGWKRAAGPSHTVTRREQPNSSPAVYLIDTPGSTQSIIATGHLTLPAGDPDFSVLRIIADVLRWRLMTNLRETKQWSYAPYALLGSSATGRQIFGAVAAVQQDKTAEAMVEILTELRGLASSRPVTSEELERAKTSELRLLAVYAQTNALTAQKLDEESRLSIDVPDSQTLGSRIEAIALTDVLRVSSRLIQPDRLVWLVVGNEGKVGDSVKALRLGELHNISTEGRLTPARR